MTRDSPLFKEFDHLSHRCVDLDDLIVGARGLVLLLRPILYAIGEVRKFAEWERRRSTVISILVVINLSCLLLSSAFFALCTVTMLLIAALFGHFHRKYNILAKVFPRPNLRSTDNGLTSGQEKAEEFRLLLVIVDSLISTYSRAISGFYSILKWDNIQVSIICYSVVCVWVLALSFLPLRFSVTFLLDICLLKRPLLNNFHIWKQQHTRDPLKPTSTSLIDRSPGQSDDANSQSSDNQLDPGFHTDSEGSEMTDEISSGEDYPVDGLSIQSLPLAHTDAHSIEAFYNNTADNNTADSLAARSGSVGTLPRSMGAGSTCALAGSTNTIPRSVGAVTVSESALTKNAVKGSQSTVVGLENAASGSESVVVSESAAILSSRNAVPRSGSALNGSGGAVGGSVSASGGGRVQGMVDKLKELKQRRQQQQQLMLAGGSVGAAIEKCTNCGVVFSSILKRKHICSNCGQYFCSRCCSYKVPRATFGATAPAAQTETVAVCRCCHDDLLGINKNKNS